MCRLHAGRFQQGVAIGAGTAIGLVGVQQFAGLAPLEHGRFILVGRARQSGDQAVVVFPYFLAAQLRLGVRVTNLLDDFILRGTGALQLLHRFRGDVGTRLIVQRRAPTTPCQQDQRKGCRGSESCLVHDGYP